MWRRSIISRASTHDTQLFIDNVLAVDSRHSRTAKDWSWPKIVVSRRKQLLFSTANSSLRRAFRSGRGGDTRVCAKAIACTDRQGIRDWLWTPRSPLSGRSTPTIEGRRYCGRRLPHRNQVNVHLDLMPNVVRTSCSPDTDGAVLCAFILGGLVFLETGVTAGDRSLADNQADTYHNRLHGDCIKTTTSFFVSFQQHTMS
jgi:hypothetical protein